MQPYSFGQTAEAAQEEMQCQQGAAAHDHGLRGITMSNIIVTLSSDYLEISFPRQTVELA